MKLGGLDIADVKIGGTQVDKVYQGADLVWQYVPPIPFEFTVKTDNAGVSTSTQFRMPLTTSTGLDIDVDWGDGSAIETITNHTLAIHTYATAGTYTIKVFGSLLGWQFNNGGDRLKMLNVVTWGALNISVNSTFRGCTNLTATATDAPIITSLNLERCFQNCLNFNGDIGNWDVSNVTNMTAMFNSALIFNKNIGNWNTSNVTNMFSMFESANAFNQDISTKIINEGQPNEYIAWDVSNVTNMNSMFYLQRDFDQNIGNWNVSSVTNFDNMFRNAANFNQNIGSWNVSNAQSMANMFNAASKFNQDIGNWNVSNVTNFIGFMANKGSVNYSAANLDSIYNGWSSLPSVKPNISISFNVIKYTAAGQAGKDILVNTYNWTITDGGI